MILKTLKLNIANRGLVTNCYIIVDEKTRETIVIDPGAEVDKIFAAFVVKLTEPVKSDKANLPYFIL